jgi:hypothetical protein
VDSDVARAGRARAGPSWHAGEDDHLRVQEEAPHLRHQGKTVRGFINWLFIHLLLTFIKPQGASYGEHQPNPSAI